MVEQVSTIMVVGAGQMGTGIAQVAAAAGYKVLLYDREPAQVEKSLKDLEKKFTENEPDSEKRQQIFSRILPVTSLKDSVRSDFVIEAATENLTIKKQIFTALSNYITQQTILATNTSVLSITEISSVTDCPDRVIGLHFMNPVPDMMLVELIRGAQTSDTTFNEAVQLAQSMNKEVVEVKDYPGFISDRLLLTMINEAITCVFDDIADVEAIDKIMQLGVKHPMGPLRLADMIGLDTCLTILETLHRDLANRKYRPCTLLRNMVKAGKLGRKSGEGFYRYP